MYKFSTELENMNDSRHICASLCKVLKEYSTILQLILEKMDKEDLKLIWKLELYTQEGVVLLVNGAQICHQHYGKGHGNTCYMHHP
jgi:hypothetical protein